MCEENETLKAQVKSGGGGGGERGGEGGGRGEESEGYTRLKAENTALQKSLQGMWRVCTRRFGLQRLQRECNASQHKSVVKFSFLRIDSNTNTALDTSTN